jgi:hypothetical protein
MHQKAALEMRVYAECGDAKLVLIDAHLDPAASDQQPGTGAAMATFVAFRPRR